MRPQKQRVTRDDLGVFGIAGEELTDSQLLGHRDFQRQGVDQTFGVQRHEQLRQQLFGRRRRMDVADDQHWMFAGGLHQRLERRPPVLTDI